MSVLSGFRRVFGLKDGEAWASYFGSRNSTGKVVTTDSAMTVAAAFACVRLLSESAGILPMGVYKTAKDGGREAVRDHPAYRLIHDGPNPDLTAAEYWESVVAQMATDGNSFALKIGSGEKVTSLEPILPVDMQVSRYPSTHELRYQFSWRGKAYDVSSDRIIHYRGFGKGGDVGLSVIRYGANTLGIAMAADDTAGRQFKKGTNSSGFIQTDKVLSEPQRVQFNKSLSTYADSDDPNKLMLLEGGFSVEQVCSMFRVPPFMIGHTEKTTSWGTGLEQQVIGFLTFALLPYLRKIESRANVALLSANDRAEGLYCKFNIEALLRADSAARMAFYAAAAQNGIMSRNEIRSKEELPRVDGGDQVTVQSNLVPLDRLGEMVTGGGANPASVKQALRAWLDIPDPPAA
jgi:phage portal protein BeeE